MTKKDYELIAGVVKYTTPEFRSDEHPDSYNAGWKDGAARQHAWLRDSLAETLAKNNPKFDRNKFLAACGIEVQHEV